MPSGTVENKKMTESKMNMKILAESVSASIRESGVKNESASQKKPMSVGDNFSGIKWFNDSLLGDITRRLCHIENDNVKAEQIENQRLLKPNSTHQAVTTTMLKP